MRNRKARSWHYNIFSSHRVWWLNKSILKQDSYYSSFEMVALCCAKYADSIPVVLMLGFFTGTVMQRWWAVYNTIPGTAKIITLATFYMKRSHADVRFLHPKLYFRKYFSISQLTNTFFHINLQKSWRCILKLHFILDAELFDIFSITNSGILGKQMVENLNTLHHFGLDVGDEKYMPTAAEEISRLGNNRRSW